MLHRKRYEPIDHKDQQIKSLHFAFVFGMFINLVSIKIGNPYYVTLFVLFVAIIFVVKWVYNQIPLIVLCSVLAANPANINATISVNLIFVILLVFIRLRDIDKIPVWSKAVTVLAIISIIGSVFSWQNTGTVWTQLANICNYVVGPFFMLPFLYCHLYSVQDASLLKRAFVLAFLLPTPLLLLLARFFGTPMVGAATDAYTYSQLVNISTYHLGGLDFQLTRTHVGIPLAALISASFAMAVFGQVLTMTRYLVFAALGMSLFLLLVTGSVGSGIAAACAVVAILVLSRKFTITLKQVLMLCVFIAVMGIGWSRAPQWTKEYASGRIEEKLSKGVDVSDRTASWKAASSYLVENPLGRGWELYVEPIRKYPHNEYLSYGIAFGFVCSFLYLFVPVKILWQFVAHSANAGLSGVGEIVLAGFGVALVLLINSFSDHLTANRWYFNVVWSMIWYGYFSMLTFATRPAPAAKSR